LTDKNGEVLVDFIGRFENFGQDLSHVFDMLGLEGSQLEIPHENRSAHSHYSEMYTPDTKKIVRKRFRKENPGDYFKFAFVRNPWDRLVSWYSMIDGARREVADGTAGPETRRHIKKNNLFKYVLRCGPTFDEFVINCTEKQWMGNGYYSFTFNQLRYLTDKNGEVLVDYIGRFENLAQDISHVFDMLGLEASQLEIPHENRSAHSHYSEMYTPETREIVRKRFRRDIEFFGYEFETAPRQVVR
jgi:protein required for attachment to host cells